MKTVLITGADRGLGLEFSQQYAQAGWQVLACCLQPENAEELNTLANQYASMRILTLDVRNHQQIEAVAAELQQVTIDVLVSNAGIYGDRHAFGELDYQVWQETLDTNVLSAIKLAEVFADHLASSQRGIFVAISSLMGGESLFLRKLVLGIPAQASGKNLTRPLMPSAPQTSCVRATSPLPS